MCDSDEEYLSAEEGEESNDEPIPTKTATILHNVVKEGAEDPNVVHSVTHGEVTFSFNGHIEETNSTEYTISVSKEDAQLSCTEVIKNSTVDEKLQELAEKSDGQTKRDSSSSTEDVCADSLTGSVTSDSPSSTQSLSAEKKQILAEVIDEVSQEIVTQVKLKPFGVDGWDDFPETPGFEVVKDPIEQEDQGGIFQQEENKESEIIANEENNDWGDWGDDPDWSLVKESSLKHNEDDSMKNIAPQTNVEETSWGWGNLASVVGDTFVNAVGSTLGLPDAEDIAKRRALEDSKLRETVPPSERAKEQHPQVSTSKFGGFGLFSGIVTGGIDVLESIGKKTFETITVKDSENGRRRLLFEANDKQNLSDLLKQMKLNEESEKASNTAAVPLARDFASMFGRSEGMSYLEALEMVSSQKPKINLPITRAFVEKLNAVNIDSKVSNFDANINTIIGDISPKYKPKELLKARTNSLSALCSVDSRDDVVDIAVENLVNYTAAAVQTVDKLACLHMISPNPCDPFNYLKLYTLLATDLYSLANQFSDQVTVEDDQTTVLIEAQTGIEFIKQANRLLVPIIFG